MPSSTASEGNGRNDWAMLRPQKDVGLRCDLLVALPACDDLATVESVFLFR
jgi:hypothetical protein